MSDVAVRASNLRKVYRLYRKPYYRLLDMVGLLGSRHGQYSEHWALDGITLEIRRGEKVGIIGRNGAGKSTLLKLVSHIIEPTTGSIEVAGNIHPLLEIGTGFHLDFTGRENVESYLANFGIRGEEAIRKIAEIVEFAELDEYIDQAVKTYSTGMMVRLMFSAATAIELDILLIAEVLGVGDAYFAQKSFEKVYGLCDAEGTTLMMVTHNLHAASMLCERIIWIDRGKIIFDGDTITAIKQYEMSLREQSEMRLRRKRLAALDAARKNRGATSTAGMFFFGHIRSAGGQPIETDIPIHRLTFSVGGHTIADLLVGEHDRSSGIHLVRDESEGNWGGVGSADGKSFRTYLAQGSIFHRAPFVLEIPAGYENMPEGGLVAEVVYKDTSVVPCNVQVFPLGEGMPLAGSLENVGNGAWRTRKVILEQRAAAADSPGGINRFGTQDFSITGVSFHRADGRETNVLDAGDTVTVRLSYKIRRSSFDEFPIIMVAFLKNGVQRTHRFVLDGVRFSHRDAPEGIIEAVAEPLLLGPGEYAVNVVVARENYFQTETRAEYFSESDQILDMHSLTHHIEIMPNPNAPLANDVMFLHPVTWKRNSIRLSRAGAGESGEPREF